MRASVQVQWTVTKFTLRSVDEPNGFSWLFATLIKPLFFLASSLVRYEDDNWWKSFSYLTWSWASNYRCAHFAISTKLYTKCSNVVNLAARRPRIVLTRNLHKICWIEIDVFENSFNYNKQAVRLILRNHFLCHCHTLFPSAAPHRMNF